MQNREYERAIAEFQNVLKLNKTNAQTHGNLGLCYAFLGHKEKAIQAFDQALAIDPEYEPATMNKAIVLSLKNGEKLPDDSVKTIEYYKEVAEERIK
jgi:Flp pilus assembly protein TadD